MTEDRSAPLATGSANTLLTQLARFGAELCAELDPSALKTTLLAQFVELFDPEKCLLAWRESKTRDGEPYSVFFSSLAENGAWPGSSLLSPGDQVLIMAQEATWPLICLLREFKPSDLPPRLQGYSDRALLILPLRLGGRFWGFAEILLRQDFLAEPIIETDFLTGYALFLAVALKNSCSFANTNRLAISDDCTALYNARFLEKCLEDEVCRAIRYCHPLVCLFLDLDHFKLVNDNHGHLNGTYLLQQVAVFIKKFVRNTDVAFRYGGDEFVILMPETGKHYGEKTAGRLLELLKAEPFYTLDRKLLTISASIGVAAFDGRMSGQGLLTMADNAMYYVKKHGRGAVKVA